MAPDVLTVVHIASSNIPGVEGVVIYLKNLCYPTFFSFNDQETLREKKKTLAEERVHFFFSLLKRGRKRGNSLTWKPVRESASGHEFPSSSDDFITEALNHDRSRRLHQSASFCTTLQCQTLCCCCMRLWFYCKCCRKWCPVVCLVHSCAL